MDFVYSRGIYRVPDEDIKFPPKSIARTTHTQRLFVVLSNQAVCTSSDWDVVVGCPLSTAESFVTEFDIELAKGVCGNSKRSWVRVHAIQPIEKTLLLSKVGDLTGQLRAELNVMISDHLNLI